MSLRNQIFISYPHADATRWKDDFLTMLAPAIDGGRINIWSDQAIPVGADWSEHIHAALASACAGLLLVTPEFFKSEYIKAVELAKLLNVAKTNGVSIWWVPISPSLVSTTALMDLKAAWDPGKPLDQLPPPEQKSAVERICTQIVEDFGFLPKVTPDHRSTLGAKLQARLGDRYEVGEESGAGRFSVVYNAKQKNPKRDVAVKVFAATAFDECASRTFKEAVQYGATLSSPAFIKIIEHSTDRPEFLISELVQGETLTRTLPRYPKGMPLSLVRRILRDLIIAFEELHAQDRVRGELYPSNVLVQPAGTPRISTVDLAAVVNSESRLAGDFRVDRESLAYMTPERFFGKPHTQLSDQFSLGLIAMEMLGGDRVPRVNCP